MNELLFGPDEQREYARLLGELLAGYETDVSKQRVFPDIDRRALRAILDEPLPEHGRPVADLFREFETVVAPNSTHITHPRYLAYVLPSANGIGPFADALASALNQNCNLWTLSPSANAIEQKVIAWFHALFEFPGSAGGMITSGGSMANLMALTIARDSHHPGDPRMEGLQRLNRRMVLYCSEQSHNSIDKAVANLGLGLNNLRHIPCDEHFRMRVDVLKQVVLDDRAQGHLPFCVVGAAGTITTGVIDPLDELADFCAEERLWLHLDGAYGALAVLSDRYRDTLRPAGRAHSLSLDPHKLLFAPMEAGCVLVRDAHHLRSSYSFVPSYLSMVPDPDFLDYAEYGPQLSRSFKAFKVWWSLRAFGRKAFAEAIDRLCDLATRMAQRIEAEPELELMAPVGFNAVCLRHRLLDEEQNARLLARLVSEGTAFLGKARIKGKFCLRACFMSLRTSEADVDAVIDEVLRLGRDQV